MLISTTREQGIPMISGHRRKWVVRLSYLAAEIQRGGSHIVTKTSA